MGSLHGHFAVDIFEPKGSKQETDYVSMVIMSKAGYDPRAYVNNAKKMVKVNESSLKRMEEELAFKIKRGQVTQFQLEVPKSLNANRLSRNPTLSRNIELKSFVRTSNS
jgi:hypothetical protein